MNPPTKFTLLVLAGIVFLPPAGSHSTDFALRHASRPASASELAFTGFVVDDADLLDISTRRRLTAQLGAFQRGTGHQLVVVTVTDLHGEDVGRFATALGNRWGVGRKEANDGVVLLVAPHERKARIAVGRGLESQLSNARCAAIMDREIIPAFARGEMTAGIEAGVTAIIHSLERRH